MTKPKTPRRGPDKAVPPRRLRADGWTIPRQRQFLKTLAVTGSVEKACDAVGMATSSAYRLRLHPEGAAFRAAWANALSACVTSLREVAFERAINGSHEEVFRAGKMVGHRLTYDNRLLMFLLRTYDGKTPPARIGSNFIAPAWPQENLLSAFESLEPVDTPDAEDTSAPKRESAPEFAAPSDTYRDQDAHLEQ